MLHRVAIALSQSLAFSDVMDALARELVHAVDRVNECTITIWHPTRDVLEVVSVYVRGEGASEDDRGDIYRLDDYPASRVLLRAADGYGVQRMTDPAIAPFVREKLIDWGWRTWIELPLVVNGRSVGLIEMADYRSARRWSQRDVDFCRTIAGQAALATRDRFFQLNAVPNFMRFDQTPRPNLQRTGSGYQLPFFRKPDGSVMGMCRP